MSRLLYALLAVWLSGLPKPVWSEVQRIGYVVSAALLASMVPALYGFHSFPTRVGNLRGTEADGRAIQTLEKRIPPGSGVFVFPYFPLIGYLLQGSNPTGYAYLQPGMMSAEDEAQALAQLIANPPRFVLEQRLPEEAILNVWPNSDRSQLTLASIREFTANHYHRVDTAGAESFEVTVYELGK